MWQAIYTKQQTKIQLYKSKIQKQQSELLRQREENEQTIENFTQLCQDLKFRGMDEVEDLQSQIGLLQSALNIMTEKMAVADFERQQMTEKSEAYLHERNEFKDQVDALQE